MTKAEVACHGDARRPAQHGLPVPTTARKMVTFRDLGFSRDQLVRLGQVFDVVEVPKPLIIADGDTELSWARMFELERISDVRLTRFENDSEQAPRQGNFVLLDPPPQSKSLGSEQNALIEQSATRVKEAEEMAEYMDYIEAGSVFFDEIVVEERVRQNILLDTISLREDTVVMDLTCCNSARPGYSTLRGLHGAEKLCLYFDNENHLFLQAIVMSSLSLFVNMNDTGERSSEQGVLVEKLVEEGFDRTEIKNSMLRALGLQDRSIASAGATRAVIRCYSGRILRKDTSIIEYATGSCGKKRVRRNKNTLY